MMISEFSHITGLSRETVRFYVRLGLFRPTTSGKGGRRPYQLFTDEDRRAAEVVRVGQSLGLSLKEIAALDTERRETGFSPDRRTEILKGQLAGLEAKAAELDSMIRFVRAKIDWVAAGGRGSHPDLGSCGCDTAGSLT
ncbi:DNA-binding transcriptional regulator, MerR family [Cupriavidus sp. OV038]|jgi:DNA-binding transcriptional MerR regulator|uniref:MerR family transcriptional regulator n=1 Tax=unclassified Cupriavidus TaxID=2640874 RepID=UPI0008EF6D64|nr:MULTISPECIES: MerR family transcriptional regulator [unclassified Cupriavidus]SFD32511.1 DNA-binding transcriptional regulator, MerR family [Cupriavidus sp. OV038]SFQ00434.1 DNA-binding transcriptional regulator, MerR family [Cupriavidus sp. OV096]